MIALLLLACVNERVQTLERNIRDLQLTVDDLDAEQRLLDQAVRQAQAEGKLAYDRNPPGWDPSRPLPPGDPNHPDVILLSIDTLRADHLSAYGYARNTSPYIASLAARGTRYADNWSPSSWTLPSHTTMLTGQLTWHHGVVEDTLQVAADTPLLQERFQSAGYRTAGVTSALFVSRKFGFDRGFDHFHDFDIHDARINNLATVTAENVFANATHWAQDQEAGKPIFLFLHVFDVHYQYSPPTPWDERFDRKGEPRAARYKNYEHYLAHPLPEAQLAHQIAAYDEEIAYVDDQLRQFLERWEASGRSVYFAVTADHGEEFAERGSWGHAHTLYPEQLHVPWVVVGPDVKAQVVSQRSGNEDIAPTLAALAGLEMPQADGVSRATQLRTGAAVGGGVPAAFADTSRFQTNRIRWHRPPYDLYVDLVNADIAVCDLRASPTCDRWITDPAVAARAAEGLDGFLGDPWTATVDGTIVVDGGAVYNGRGAPLAKVPMTAGSRFTVLPGDAKVSFLAADGTRSGPWQPLGGALPDAQSPLQFAGRSLSVGVALSDEEKAMLEALGYVQEGGGGADAGPAKAGKGGKGGKAKADAEAE